MITNSNYPKIIGERSTSEHRGPSIMAKPIRPLPFASPCRAASAENRRMPVPWGLNNSPHVLNNLSKRKNHLRSSPTSLSSSSALSIDEQSGSVYNLKSFEKFAHMGQPHVVALYNFETGVEGDLEFEVGDIIMLEDIVDESWYKGRSIKTGAVGIFPMNHVEVRIPLTTGLFTDKQPKTKPVHPVKSRHILTGNRTNSHPSFRKKPIPLPKTANQSAPPCNSSESLNSQITDHSSNLNTAQYNMPSSGSEIYSSSPQANLPSNNLLSSRTQMFSKPVLPTPPLPLPPSSQQQQQQPKNSHVPPVINSLKPRNQTTISQLAQLLQERGIVSYRSRGMPSGATHLYPGSHPLLVSSTPSSIENHKSPTEMNDVNTSDNNGGKDDNNGNSNNKDNSDDDKKKTTTNEKSVKGGAYHSPLMVETVLSKLLPELNKSSCDSIDSNGLDKTPQNKFNLNLRAKSTKRLLDNERRHTAEVSCLADATDSNNGNNNNICATGTTNHNKNRHTASSYVKNLSESYLFNGGKLHEKDIKSTVDSTPLRTDDDKAFTSTNGGNDDDDVSNAKNADESYDNVSNFGDSSTSQLRSVFQVIKPPEKLVTSKGYIKLSSASTKKSASTNQLALTSQDQQSLHNETNSSGQSNGNKVISVNSWLTVKRKQAGNESTGELRLNVGDVLRCIDLVPGERHTNPSTIPLSLSLSSSDKWIECENWFGVTGLVNTSNVQVIDNPNELAAIMQHRPHARVVYAFQKETDEDLALTPGDIVYLFEAIDENWYRGESASSGHRGMFPATFVEVIKPL